MRNLIKDIKSHKPLLIQPTQAESYLERASQIEIPMGAKMSDMGEMLEAIFGAKQTLEKFPPFAVVPVKGVISKNISELESLCGCCDIHDVEEMLEECERDASITTIILDIDSCGGTSVGVPELANRIKNSSKKVISFTSNEACSAAYWIGSQASEFYATGSATVGSIGVYICFNDISKMFEMEGVKADVIRAGKFKGAGIQGTSLDENQRKMLQDEVLDIHQDFKEAVKSVRSFVEDVSMEGQSFSGKRAAEAGLVTGLVNGFDELMESLDKGVAQQMEADEENDERAEVSELVSEEEEDEEKDEYGIKKMASGRALSGIASAVLKRDYSDPEDPDYDPDEDPELKDTPDDEKKDGVPPNEKCPTCGKPHDEEKCEEEDGESDTAKEGAEDEAAAGDKAVETDAKHDKSGKMRHNGGKLN
jgi:signal peptide peptidase SppA